MLGTIGINTESLRTYKELCIFEVIWVINSKIKSVYIEYRGCVHPRHIGSSPLRGLKEFKGLITYKIFAPVVKICDYEVPNIFLTRFEGTRVNNDLQSFDISVVTYRLKGDSTS